VAVSADGKRIVSGSQDGTMKVWNLPRYEAGKETARLPAALDREGRTAYLAP
jgi:hypothetical protein